MTPTDVHKQFAFDHLPTPQAEVAAHFHELAVILLAGLPEGEDRDWALDDLLQSQRSALRSARALPPVELG